MEPSPQEKHVREQIRAFLNRHLQAVAAMAGIPMEEGEGWGLRHISWTGEEWPGLGGRPGLCFVEIFLMRTEPHDHLLILDVSAGTCTLAATYRRELDHMRLIRTWSPATDSPAYAPLPGSVPWRILGEMRAHLASPHLLPGMPASEPDAEACPVPDRRSLEALIRQDIKRIAKESCLVGVDDHYWDVTRISWTGEEWAGLPCLPDCCYVEAFEHSNPPHDFLYVVSVRRGRPEFIAAYEGDIGTFDLTIFRAEADSLNLPDQVER